MNKEERLTKSMLDMANGAIKERVDVEMPRIIKNIMDVNTNATKPRKMMLTLTFTPDEQRQVIATKCEIKSTLQPTNPVTTSLYIGEFAGEVKRTDGRWPCHLSAGGGKAAGAGIYGRGNRLLHHGKRRWLSGCQQ